MPILGQPKQLLKAYKFVVECDRLGDMRFQKCGQLEREIEIIEYAEGGSLYNLKDAGRLKFSAVTLTRGLCAQDHDLEQWFTEAAAAGDDIGGIGDSYKANVDIVNLQRDNSAGMRWRLFNAWPSKLTIGEWDSTSTEVTVAELTLAFDYALPVS